MKKYTGDLIITKANQNKYKKLKEITGYLYVYEGATANLPVLTSIGGSIAFYQGATADLTVLTSIGRYLYIYEEVTLSIPNLNVKSSKKTLKIGGKEYEIVLRDGILFYADSVKSYKGIKIYYGQSKIKIVENSLQDNTGFLVEKEGFSAHGSTLKSAISDLQFKIVAEKLRNEPILPETEITVMYYRTVTGSCDLGCRDFMERNGIAYKIEDNKTVELEPITAKNLLPILEKNNAYGVEKFKSLINW